MTARLLAALVVGAVVLVGWSIRAEEPVIELEAVGTIQSVQDDYSGFELLLDDESQRAERFTVGPATKFVLNGEESTAAEALVVGARATVRHAEGENQATEVEVATEQNEES